MNMQNDLSAPRPQASNRISEFAQKMADEIIAQFSPLEQNTIISEMKGRIIEYRDSQIQQVNMHLEELIRSRQSLEQL